MRDSEDGRGLSKTVKTSIIVGSTLAAILVWCLIVLQRVTVPEGAEAVVIAKPWFIGDGGVQEEVIPTGSKWIWRSSTAILISIVPEDVAKKYDDMTTSDNFPVDFETHLQIQVLTGKSPELIKTFGQNWYANNVASQFNEYVRREIAHYTMTDLITKEEKLREARQHVYDSVVDYMKSAGLPVRVIRLTIGKVDPDPRIREERNETGRQQQRIQTEGQKKLAEDARKEAETARAVADNAYRNALNLSPELFVDLEKIKAQERMCATAKDGCTLIMGGSPAPVLPVK